jgi:tryptophan synthase alpha chain
MNRLDAVFADLKAKGRRAFIPFLTAGDPSLDATPGLASALIEAGADVLEIGFPYSDPIADGPVIQASYTRALEKKIKLAGIFEMLKPTTPEMAAPVVTMVSYAIVYRHGLERYVAEAKTVGVAGAIVPDLPVDEAEQLARVCRKEDFSLIQLVTPTTPRERALRIAASSSGFI